MLKTLATVDTWTTYFSPSESHGDETGSRHLFQLGIQRSKLMAVLGKSTNPR